MYIVKLNYKDDPTTRISITLKNNYREFDSIMEVIDFLFEQSIYIKSYRIFRAKEIKQKGFKYDPGGVRIVS